MMFFQLAKEFGEEFNKHIDQYLQRVVGQIRDDVGKCWPMSQAYNATLVAGCKKILNPYVSIIDKINMFVRSFLKVILLNYKFLNRNSLYKITFFFLNKILFIKTVKII